MPGNRVHEGGRHGYLPPMSDDKLSKGDEVTWQSHGSTAKGTVEEKITLRHHGGQAHRAGVRGRSAVPRA